MHSIRLNGLRIASALVFLLDLNACGGGSGGAAPPTIPTQPTPGAPVITMQLVDQSVTAPGTASFTITATGAPTLFYEWQVSIDGGVTFSYLNSNGNTANYTTPATVASDNGKKFRVVVYNSAGNVTAGIVTSYAATLTVNVGPTVALGATLFMPGQTSQARALDASGAQLSGISWRTSDPSVATISAAGLVLATGAGSAVISATSQGHTGFALLAVQIPPISVTSPVFETLPTVYPFAGGNGVVFIVDGTATTSSVAITVYDYSGNNIPPTQLPLQRFQGTNRFFIALSDAQVAPTCHFNGRISCVMGNVLVTNANGSTNPLYPALGLAPTSTLPSITTLAADVQRSEYVFNVRDDGSLASGNTSRVTQRFYQFFTDEFDYIALMEIANSDVATEAVVVRSRVSGTGRAAFDNSAAYGASASGSLLGLLYLTGNTPDLAQQATSHEMGHAFMVNLQGTALSTAYPHWPLSTTAFAIMGSNGNPGSNSVHLKLTPLGSGAYRVDAQTPYGGFNNLELYLMGLAYPSEVEDQVVFQDQTQPATVGSILNGPETTVTIGDIIAANGIRSPGFAGTPVTFNLATVVISRGRLLTPLEMAYYQLVAQRGEATTSFDNQYATPFYVNTKGRGILVTRIP